MTTWADQFRPPKPSASKEKAVRCDVWIEALAKELERRADAMVARGGMTIVEIVLEQSFRDRAEDLRRAHERSASIAKSSDLRTVDVEKAEQREPQVRCDAWLGEATDKSGARARSGAGGASKAKAEGQTL
jgi:hypothetical protein